MSWTVRSDPHTGARRASWISRCLARPSVGVAAVLLGLVVPWAAGCTSARNTLGTNASPCFTALPAAAKAVDHRGSFTGVLLVNVSTLDRKVTPRQAAMRAQLEQRAGHRLHSVCLVSYRGRFAPAQVSDPIGSVPAGGSGQYAVVVLEYPGDKLLGTFIRAKEPLSFIHSRVGS